MFNILSSLRGLLKVHSISIDNDFFRLHYKLTAVILLAFSMVVTSVQFFRDPMDCYFPDFPHGSLNTYCYVHSTFLTRNQSIRDALSRRLPFPGTSTDAEEDELKFYDYYEWIFLSLTLQAILFYIPHYIWKAWEGGRMKMLAEELAAPVLSKDRIENNIGPLVDYFCTTLHSHNIYFYKYFTCELLNLVNVVAQIAFMNAFLGEDFSLYGIDVMMFNQSLNKSKGNPVELLFPTITECSYSQYSPTGTPETRVGICVLPQNSINGQIYVILWFWFRILAVISAIMVVYRLVTLVSSSVRFYRFRSVSSMSRAKDITLVFNNLKIGDWFLLHMLHRNMNILAYKELISRIAQHFEPSIMESDADV